MTMIHPPVSGDVHSDGEGGEARLLVTPALRKVLTSATRRVSTLEGPATSTAIELAPRGQWLATAGGDAFPGPAMGVGTHA
ncbi:hypothetical protein [Streptomyces spinosirectus]